MASHEFCPISIWQSVIHLWSVGVSVFPNLYILYHGYTLYYIWYRSWSDLCFFCLSQFQLVGFFGTNYIKLQENPIEIMGKSSVIYLYIIWSYIYIYIYIYICIFPQLLPAKRTPFGSSWGPTCCAYGLPWFCRRPRPGHRADRHRKNWGIFRKTIGKWWFSGIIYG